MRKQSLLIFLAILFCTFAQAQNMSRRLQWIDKDTSATARSTNYPRLYFYGSTPDAQQLPFFSEIFSGSRNLKLAWYNAEPVPANELRKINNTFIPTDFRLTQEFSLDRGQPRLRVTLMPIRKNANGVVERITSFGLEFADAQNSNRLFNAARPKVLEATQSVLSSGKWVKLRIPKTGVYKLTDGKLREWGFANLSAISVWSNGCDMLPRLNSQANPDDLAQLPTRKSGSTIFFYAEATNTWIYDSQKKFFKHVQNEFSASAYVYITDGRSTSEMPTLAQTSGATDVTSTYDYRDYKERVDTNLLRSGRRFFGEVYDAVRQRSLSFNIPSLSIDNPQLKMQVCAAAGSTYSSSYSIAVNGGPKNTLNISPTSSGEYMHADTALFENIPLSTENANLSITYNRPANSPGAWGVWDFTTINARAKLNLLNTQLLFRDAQTIGAGRITKFNIGTSQQNVKVWDVTNLHKVKEIEGVSASGNSITVATDSLREFVAFTENMAMEPEYVNDVLNQNLHAVSSTDLIVVTHPDFISQSERIAQFHRTQDGMSAQVFTTEQIYNEFSSGIADVSAIRNFVRMLYRRNAATAPKYLLFVGSGSYVNYNGKAGVSQVPTYQSENSLVSDLSYVSDDFFVLLDNNEYLDDGGMHGFLDMAVGRIPVYNTAQANTLVNKLEKYNSDLSGDWMSKCVFIADDEDSNIHMQQSEELGNYILDSFPSYYVNKIYLDAYAQKTTPMGDRYPDVNDAISSAVDAGALIVNYTGHANDQWMAHEQVVTPIDIDKWNNRNRLPLFVTATCEFSRFDDPAAISSGERILFLDKGGSIAMLSTTRLVFSNGNDALNKRFIETFFSQKDGDGKHLRLGEIVRRTKNSSSTGVNQLNFSLLGDPALMLLFPSLTASTSKINGISYSTPDTLKALAKASISGNVNGSNIKDTIVVSVFDKEQIKKTIGNSGEVPFSYRNQSNPIYKGKVTTPNGAFTANFIVPQDIAPQFGKGKIAYVGKAGSALVAGSNPVPVGGTSGNDIVDTTPPNIRIYMNSERWVPGGITNESPTFIALLSDSSGINTTGNGVGHDITLKIQQNNKSYTLNSYYVGNTDSYTNGRIDFPIPPLSQGPYSATLKVWDAVNNSAEKSIEFLVANEDVFTISRVLNYPNPFTQKTAFFFEHNRPYMNMDVLIQVFTISGKLVKTIRYSIPASSSLRSAPIEWDGRDDYGSKLGRGTYLYKAKVRCSNGEFAEKLEKIVVLN